MNRILKEIRKIMDENMALYLPHVKNSDLEKSGAIFYMNANNGTEFDWYVNDRLPAFMVFYDDEENLGAAKLLLYKDGRVEGYLYDEQGKKFLKQVDTNLNADETEIMKLAATLKNEADDKKIWDADMEGIHTDIEIDQDGLEEFKGNQESYRAVKNRKKILNQTAFVSNKIIEEGWKIGYMERNDPCGEEDSGWFLASGTEAEDYFSDYKNVNLVCVGIVCQQLDPDIFQYIDQPIGTRLIRVSQDKFELDGKDKEIYAVKR